jgi:hypothetical protein
MVPSAIACLTTEDQTEHKADAKRGEDRLRWVLPHVLFGVVLKSADAIGCVVPNFLRPTAILVSDGGRGRLALLAPLSIWSSVCDGIAAPCVMSSSAIFFSLVGTGRFRPVVFRLFDGDFFFSGDTELDDALRLRFLRSPLPGGTGIISPGK